MNEHSFEPLKIAVDLLINTSKIIQAWITRFIAVNAALFTAIAFMLTWKAPTILAGDVSKGVLVAMCVLGMIASVLMGGVALHQIEWVKRIQGLVLDLQKTLGVVVHPEPFWPIRGVFTTTFVYVMMVAVSLAWVWLGVFIYMRW